MSDIKPRYFFVQQDGHSVEDGIIKNVSAITKGEAKGHGVYTDDKFIDDVVAQGNAAPRGIKCRLGHPALFADAMGTYIGRLKNFRREGDKAKADLHLSKAAKKSPKGDLYSYVMELAKEDADQFGLSIAFEESKIFKKDDDDCEYVELGKLLAVDVVDEPAANPGGLFSLKTTPPYTVEGIEIPLKIENEKINKEIEQMELIKQMMEKFGAAKAAEYFSAGLTIEQAQIKFDAENSANELAGMKAAIAEKDGAIAKMGETIKSLESKIAELGKGSAPVAMSAQSEPKTLTFEAVVAGIMATGKTQFDAIREASISHKDLHAEWLKTKKTKFNSVV